MTNPESKDFAAQIPILDLSEGTEMLNDFSREAQRHLISARNSLLVLESVPTDKESIENVFKTFHTIKGLADFLKLHDIFWLTGKVEMMLDLIRKEALICEPQTVHLIEDTVKSLQKLLELLDEQIAHDGKLKSPYLDVGPLIKTTQEMIDRKDATASVQRANVRILPKINFEPDMTIAQRIEDVVKVAPEDVTLEKSLIKELLGHFNEVTRELKEAQGKLHERQRELIKERELAIKLTHQAQTEARNKSEYLANMSHEIRTLINAILGFASLLRESPLSDKQRDHLQTITVSGKMLLEIVNDILDFSKVEAGKLKLENIEFNLEHITEEVFKILRSRITSKELNLYLSISDDTPLVLMGDPTRTKQIFMNLLDNAIKFTENGELGMTISLANDVLQRENSVWIRFIVNDTGIGIPANRINSLFQSFTQMTDSTARVYGGTGLGLALCKTFVEKMGGHIDVESILGTGTTFTFLIPFGISSKAKAVEKPLTDNVPAQLNVMIVTAHDKTGETFIHNMKTLSAKTILTAKTAKQASEDLLKLENEGQSLPNMIFIDTMLPNKEAFMLAYKIRQQERYNAIHLIAIACDGRIEVNDDYQQAGFVSSMMKPIIRQELAETIARIFTQKPSENRVIAPMVLQKISCAGVKVLVVEDSLPNQELLKIHLETLGCSADYALNGKEAIEFLKTNTYDICLMDLQMPIMGGVETSKYIRTELKNSVPIVALTAAEIQEEREKCFTAGMNDYLAKPFGIDELKEIIIKCTKM
jgi:two-component system sensor histidine kinase/response regulator